MSIKAFTIDDGGLFLRPIPGDMLRVAERKPQVSTSSKQERNQNQKACHEHLVRKKPVRLVFEWIR